VTGFSCFLARALLWRHVTHNHLSVALRPIQWYRQAAWSAPRTRHRSRQSETQASGV